jgi:toxin ParE1/3/4
MNRFVEGLKGRSVAVGGRATMSSRKLPVIVSPRAQADYEDILAYGLPTRGEEQALAYEAAIDGALDDLGAFPQIGRARDELSPGYRSYPVEQHVIYYRVSEAAVTVIGIQHSKMSPVGCCGSERRPITGVGFAWSVEIRGV